MRDESRRSRAIRFWLPPGRATNLAFLFWIAYTAFHPADGSGGQLGNV